MPEQTEWGIELPATPANGEYREPMGEARKAGLEARNATRLERAQQRATLPLAAEVDAWLQECGSCDYALPMGCVCPKGDPRAILLKVWQAHEAQVAEAKALAETATELGRRLGRKEAAEEIGAAIEAAEEGPATSHEPLYGYWHAAQIARAIGDGKTPAEVDDAILTDWAARRADVARRIAGGSA